MGEVIKGNFGGQEKTGENNPADSIEKKPADVVEIKPSGNGEKEDAAPWRDIVESAAKVSPAEAVRRLNKMAEALNYIASLAGVIPSKLRSGSSYTDNIIVFQNMYSQGAQIELFKALDDSSKEMWGKAPGYYLALIDTLRRYDWD